MSNDSSSAKKHAEPAVGRATDSTDVVHVPKVKSKKAKTEEIKSPAARPTGVTDVVRPPKGKPKKVAAVPWGPWMAVIYAVVVYFAAQVVAGIALVVCARLFGWSTTATEVWVNSSVFAQFLYVLLAEALTFGAIWWFIKMRGSTLRAIGWRRIRWSDGLRTLAGFAVYFVSFVVVLGIATHLFPSINVDQQQQLGFDNASGSSNLVLTFLSLVILPPLVEETVFRGFVYTGLRGKLRPVIAALITSALFAAAHLEFGSGKPLLWVAGIDTFILSLVLCYLRQKSDSLWPGIMLHALKNCIAFVSLFLLVSH